MEFATGRSDAEGGIARIVMNRPAKGNALNHQLLDAAFRAAEDDATVQVIVLSGAGPAFCAGYDLTGSYYATPPAGGGG